MSSSQLTFIFFRGVQTTNQMRMIYQTRSIATKWLKQCPKPSPRSHEVLQLQSHLSKPEYLILQNAILLRKLPWPSNISGEHVCCTAPTTQNASLQISSHVPRLQTLFKLLHNHHVLLTLDKVHSPLRLPRKTTWLGASNAFPTKWFQHALRHLLGSRPFLLGCPAPLAGVKSEKLSRNGTTRWRNFFQPRLMQHMLLHFSASSHVAWCWAGEIPPQGLSGELRSRGWLRDTGPKWVWGTCDRSMACQLQDHHA